MNANSGYIGWSKSRRAGEAEDNGLLPLSHIGGGAYVKAAAKLLGAAEWHHTSKFFNRTDYYDARAVRALAAQMKRSGLKAEEAFNWAKHLRHRRRLARFGSDPRSVALRQAVRLLKRAADLDAERPVDLEYAWRDRPLYAALARFEAHAVIRRALRRPHLESTVNRAGERVTQYCEYAR